MAEKGLADVTEGLKAVQGAIENPPKSAADKEAATEKARSDAANKSIFQGIYDTLQKGFGAATGKDKKSGGLIAGLLGGIGAGLGGIGKAVGSLGMGFAKGMIGLGAGIGGFAIALGGAAMILSLMGTDGSALTSIITNFFDAFTPENAAKMGVIVVVAGLLSALKVSGARMAAMMTAIGAGIAGFAGGILIGSKIAGYGLAALGGLDTTSLTTLLHGFFSAFTPEIAAGVGVIVTLAAVAAKLLITPLQMAAGMTGIGAGIAGFSIGILLADGAAKLGEMANLDGSSLKTLISNFMGAFDGIGIVALGALIIAGAAVGIVPGGVVAVVAGMTAIGAGIAGFMVPLLAADWIAGLGGDNAGGNLATLLTNIGKGIGGFLGGFAGETFEQMKMIDGDKLAQIGKGILNLGLGMVAFAGGRAAGGIADIAGGIGNAIGSLFGSEKKGPLHVFAEISKDKSIDADRLTALGGGIFNLARGLGAFAAVNSTGLAANAISTKLITGSQMFMKALDFNIKSQENSSAGNSSGGDTYNTISNTDASTKVNQTTAVSIPENSRTNESTVRALQMVN